MLDEAGSAARTAQRVRVVISPEVYLRGDRARDCRPRGRQLGQAEALLAALPHPPGPAAADSSTRSSTRAATCVCSSRAGPPLHLSSEQEFPVPALPLPARSSSAAAVGSTESVRLFAVGDDAAVPGFAVDAGNAEHVGGSWTLGRR